MLWCWAVWARVSSRVLRETDDHVVDEVQLLASWQMLTGEGERKEDLEIAEEQTTITVRLPSPFYLLEARLDKAVI